jgi:hypothetical protein
MADTKISALSAVSTLDGTEIFPVVQGGVTEKVTLSQINSYIDPIRQVLTTAQTLGTGDTYVTDSRIVLPQAKMQAGVYYKANLVITKTGAGVAAPVFTMRSGTLGTTSDTSRFTYTGVAQTAIADTAFVEVQVVFKVVGINAQTSWWLRFTHDLATTGFANITRDFQNHAAPANWNSTTAGTGIGLSINAGAASAWTIQQCTAELLNLAD